MPDSDYAQTKTSSPALNEPVAATENADGVNATSPDAQNEQKTQDTPSAQLYDEYVSMVQAYGYALDETVNNVNVIGIRGWLNGQACPNVKNRYNDSIICVWKTEEDGKVVKHCEEFIASVDPGTFSKVYNSKGDANLMEGQYDYRAGTHNTYSAFVTSSSTVWRDGKKAERTDSAIEETGSFGINLHAAGGAKGNVGDWSAGCQIIASVDGTMGANNTAFKHFRDDIIGQDTNKKFTYTLINGADFQEKNLTALSNENRTKTNALLNDAELQTAINYNNKNAADITADVQAFLKTTVTGVYDKTTVMNIAYWQLGQGLTAIDGEIGPTSRKRLTDLGMQVGQAEIGQTFGNQPTQPVVSQTEETNEAKTIDPVLTETENAETATESDKPAWLSLPVNISVSDAIRYNKNNNADICVDIQRFVYAEDDGIFGRETVTHIAQWQKSTGVLDVDGKFGSESKRVAKTQGFGGAASQPVISSPTTAEPDTTTQEPTSEEQTEETPVAQPTTSEPVTEPAGATSPYDLNNPGFTVNINVASAIKYCNNTFGNICSDIQRFMGVSPTGTFDEETVTKIAIWQQLSGLGKPDGMFGPTSMKTAISQGMKLTVDQDRLANDSYFKLTEEKLARVIPRGLNYFSEILYAFSLANINTLYRAAAFISQIVVETDHFNTLNEYGDDNYFARYEYRSDLGNTQPGDGVKFHGRGAIQLTGRANYQSCSDALGVPEIMTNPSCLADNLELAFRSAAWYWTKRDINSKADQDDIHAVNLAVNGGTNGADERKKYYNLCKENF